MSGPERLFAERRKPGDDIERGELVALGVDHDAREQGDFEGEDDEVEDNSSDIQEHEEEEEEVADYTTNYYASEDESDGGGDGEATF